MTAAVPFLFLWLGVYLTVRTHLQSVVNVPLAFHDKTDTPAVDFLEDKKRPLLTTDTFEASKPLWPPKGLFVPFAVVIIPIALFIGVHRTPLDGWRTAGVIKIGACLVMLGLAWSLNRVIVGAANLERLLLFFRSGDQFDRVEPFFATLPPKQFGRFQVLRPTVRLLAEFLESWNQLKTLPQFKTLADGKVKLEEQLEKDLHRFDTWPAWGSLSFEFLHQAANLISKDKDWSRWVDTPENKARTTLLGAYVVLLVSWALGAIRTFLFLATALAACIWVAFVSYPQSPHHLLLVAAWLAMGICLVIGVVTFVRFERNEVLSAMSRTTAGAVTFDASSLRAIGPLLAGPVLAIVVFEFPQFGRWLAEWAQPLLLTMK